MIIKNIALFRVKHYFKNAEKLQYLSLFLYS